MGEGKGKSVIKFGFIGQIFAVLMIIFTGMCPAVDSNIDAAYHVLLGQTWIFVTGSLCAYYASQSWDVFFFHKSRNKYVEKHGSIKGGKWIWNCGSTMTSQIIDTFVYAMISFGIGLGWLWTDGMIAPLIGLMIGQYVLKACLALLDTPFFYFFTRGSKTDILEEVIA